MCMQMEFGTQRLEHVFIQLTDVLVSGICDVLPVNNFVIFMGGTDVVPSVVICKLIESNL